MIIFVPLNEILTDSESLMGTEYSSKKIKNGRVIYAFKIGSKNLSIFFFFKFYKGVFLQEK